MPLNSIVAGKKICDRVQQNRHSVTKKIVDCVSMIDYELFVHKNSEFLPLPIFTLILTIHEANIAYIEQSLRSVFCQTYKNTEVILINNGAGEKASELIWSYFRNHKNAKLIRTKKNLYNPTAKLLLDPIAHLWNAGLFCSIGDFVYFMSYDDLISTNYAEQMTQLFVENENCCTAAPLVVSVDALGEVNIDASNHLKACNQRGKYTNGISLAQSYMRGENKIGFPGGLLSIRSNLVLDCGGFDKNNDLSQLFKFAICGSSGFSSDAVLYWRHHENQIHNLQRKMGMVYYRNLSEFNDVYSIKVFHQKVAGAAFALEYEQYINRYLDRQVISEFRGAYTVSFYYGVKALMRIFLECPFRLQLLALRHFLKYCPKYFYRTVAARVYKLFLVKEK